MTTPDISRTSASASAYDGPLVVVMGVSGSGKSAVGAALADRLGVPFVDADDLHPAANIAAMRAGRPLTDSDREPWLRAVNRWLREHAPTTLDPSTTARDASPAPAGGVIACSALKRRYRDVLREGCDGVVFVHLHGEPAVIQARLQRRRGHFMPASLLDSQLRTLEPLHDDEGGITVDVAQPIERIVEQVLRRLQVGRRP